MFELEEVGAPDSETGSTVIKVVGVGGAGGNAVEHMIRERVGGVEFICCNTDAQALNKSNAHVKLQLGPGLGAGGKPEKARDLALLDRERIAEALSGAHMVFITAGMGGGTGTGAGPVVAEVARELGILTVAVVTKPFEYEGKRKRLAEEGVAELARHVDSLIVILNEKLEEVLGDEVSMLEAFQAADNVLRNAVGGIAEIINVPGLVNVDFEDVRTVMGEMGKAMMGSAVAAGVDRARVAAEEAVASPLLEGIELSGARGVLVNITASSTLGLKEYKEVMKTIRQYTAPEATVICGAVFDETMEDQLRVTVVATGLGVVGVREAAKPAMRVVETIGLRTGTDNVPVFETTISQGSIDLSSVTSSARGGAPRNAQADAMAASGSGQVRHSGFSAPPVGLILRLCRRPGGRLLPPGRPCVIKFPLRNISRSIPQHASSAHPEISRQGYRRGSPLRRQGVARAPSGAAGHGCGVPPGRPQVAGGSARRSLSASAIPAWPPVWNGTE
jgi:cell division protein FtsZ